MQLIPSDWKLPEKLASRFGEQAGRQRTMVAEGHLLLVLHAVPTSGESDRVGRLFWRKPDGHWDSSALGGGTQALIRQLDEYGKVIDRLEDDLQAAEHARDFFAVLRLATPLLRAARNMQQALQEARDAIPDDRELINARDRAASYERGLELINADGMHGLDFTIAQRGEEMALAGQDLANASHRLNVIAAIFLPLSALTSVFGMQLKNGLEDLASPVPFLVVLAVALIVGVAMKAFVSRPGVRPDEPRAIAARSPLAKRR